jgi:hypothetical protein
VTCFGSSDRAYINNVSYSSYRALRELTLTIFHIALIELTLTMFHISLIELTLRMFHIAVTELHETLLIVSKPF